MMSDESFTDILIATETKVFKVLFKLPETNSMIRMESFYRLIGWCCPRTVRFFTPSCPPVPAMTLSSLRYDNQIVKKGDFDVFFCNLGYSRLPHGEADGLHVHWGHPGQT